MDKDIWESWSKFLNPNLVRKHLMHSGLFLITYEVLIDILVRHPKEFFDDNHGFGKQRLSQKYQHSVLQKDPKGKGDTLRASIEWFKELGALCQEDILEIAEIRAARNAIAHDLGHIVMSGGEFDYCDFTNRCLTLIDKVETWWITNFEFAIDETLAGSDLADADITPGQILILQALRDVALGDDEKAWFYFNEFQKQKPDPK